MRTIVEKSDYKLFDIGESENISDIDHVLVIIIKDGSKYKIEIRFDLTDGVAASIGIENFKDEEKCLDAFEKITAKEAEKQVDDLRKQFNKGT